MFTTDEYMDEIAADNYRRMLADPSMILVDEDGIYSTFATKEEIYDAYFPLT